MLNQLEPTGQFDSRAVVASSALLERGPAPASPVQLSEQARDLAASLSHRSISATILAGCVRAIEFVGITLIGIVIYALYVAPVEGIDSLYALPLLLGAATVTVLIQAAEGYSVPSFRSRVGHLARIWLSWTLVFAFFAVAAFLTKTGAYYSRGFFVGWYFGGIAFFAVSRLALSRLVRRWVREGRLRAARGHRRRRPAGSRSDRGARRRSPTTTSASAAFSTTASDDRSPAVVAGYPKLGTVAELVAFGRVARIDMLIVSLPITAENRLLQFLKQLWVLPVDIRLSAHTNQLRFRPRVLLLSSASVPFLDIFDRPIADWDCVSKRAFDVVFASLLLVLFSPLMLLTALRDQARHARPGPVPPEALRLQQRGDRRPQVPVDVPPLRRPRGDARW